VIVERFEQQQGGPAEGLHRMASLDLDPTTLEGINWEQVPYDPATIENWAYGLIDGKHPIALEWGVAGEPDGGLDLHARDAEGANAATEAFGAEPIWTPILWEEAGREAAGNPYEPQPGEQPSPGPGQAPDANPFEPQPEARPFG
jgi:hypothetical protein